MKRAHVDGENASIGPVWFFESRTSTTSSIAPTSTQSPELPLLLAELFRKTTSFGAAGKLGESFNSHLLGRATI
jgi:hypothetical protein